MAGTEFTAERRNVTVVQDEIVHSAFMTPEQEEQAKQAREEHKKLLRVPRRPKWDKTTTAEELDQNEKDNFLEWRRGLAELQQNENLTLTPFERNLEVWRQLWRVIERSEVVVQIVDARNPMLFRCEDLEVYVHEISPHKKNLLLINKSDMLTVDQRKIWADYLDSKGISFLFW
eukprot:Colp12_sorted_trinity150504_noHs@16051